MLKIPLLTFLIRLHIETISFPSITDIADAGNYMIVYYCGHMTKDWWYEGNLVYSRDPTLGPIDVANVATFLKNTMGHTMDQYCVPNTTNCISSIY